jgi:hypothetical protein
VTSHNKRTRGRSRKRRRSGAPVGTAGHAPGNEASAAPATSAGKPRSGGSRSGAGSSAPAKRTRGRAAPRRGAGLADLLPVGKRPPAPWSPLPLSELLILIGAIGTIVGLSRGVSNGLPPLIAGLAAVAIGTVEVTLREHLSGYRSHTIVLAMLPVVVLDSAVVLLVAPFGTGLKLGLLAADVAIVAALYKLLRARFLDARRERVFSEGR